MKSRPVRVCPVRPGHLISCLFLVLSCWEVLKNLVIPYSFPTLGAVWWGCLFSVWGQRGATVTVLNNDILFQESWSPFPAAGVPFRHWVRWLFVCYCNLRAFYSSWEQVTPSTVDGLFKFEGVAWGSFLKYHALTSLALQWRRFRRMFIDAARMIVIQCPY